MRPSLLPLLACPAGDEDRPACGGSLEAVDEGALPLRFSADGEDLREGLLRCLSCRTLFPVLSGVAVLPPDPAGYLRRHRSSLERDLAQHGEFSEAVRRYLRRAWPAGDEDYGADFRFSQQFEEPVEVAAAMESEGGPGYGAFAGWLKQVEGNDPYSILTAWRRELAPPGGFLLDAGCGGGGLLARLAEGAELAVGIDLSFLSLLLARRTVLHLPEPELAYRLTRWRGDELHRPLSVPRRQNAEFLVGDACRAPFPAALFSSVASCNVIDMAGMEGPLDEAARLLSPGGLLLLSNPFFFRKGLEPGGEPVAALRRALQQRSCSIEREQDGAPWTWSTYQRHWHVYFCCCIAARRGAEETPQLRLQPVQTGKRPGPKPDDGPGTL